MTGKSLLFHYGVLLVLGVSWGLSTPLSKIAVKSGHGQIGLVFWQLFIGVVLMAGVNMYRSSGLPLNRRTFLVFFVIALIGTIIPD